MKERVEGSIRKDDPSPKPEDQDPSPVLKTISERGPAIQFTDKTLPGVADNLAFDEAMLVDAEDRGGPGVLRIWESKTFAVVMGASCRLLENVQVEACKADGVTIARRASGGGTVVIGPGALNFSVVLPIAAESEFKSVDTAQVFVLERVARSIRETGPPVEVLGSGDLTVGRRKFSGSAQRRLRHYLLIHASLLYDFPLDRIDRYTLKPPRQPKYREDRPHLDFVTNVPMSRVELVAAIRRAWLDFEDTPVLANLPMELVQSLSQAKFSDPRWIERL